MGTSGRHLEQAGTSGLKRRKETGALSILQSNNLRLTTSFERKMVRNLRLIFYCYSITIGNHRPTARFGSETVRTSGLYFSLGAKWLGILGLQEP